MSEFKKLQYDCDKQGCFNKKRRLDFSCFYELLPRKISFSDVDGICEIKGYFVILEWKTFDAPLSDATKRLLCSFSKIPKCTSIVAWGDTESMTIDGARVYCKSNMMHFDFATTDVLKSWVKTWGEFADANNEMQMSDFIDVAKSFNISGKTQ